MFMNSNKLFLLKCQFHYVIEQFPAKPMVKFSKFSWVLLCSVVCHLFEFLLSQVVGVVDDLYKRNSISTTNVYIPQEDDDDDDHEEDSSKNPDSDGLFNEKDKSEFMFGFKFETGNDMNFLSYAETDSSVSKYQFSSGEDVSGFIQGPETMSFIDEESFGGFINKDVSFCSEMIVNKDLVEQVLEGLRGEGSDQFIEFKVSSFEDGHKIISEEDFLDHEGIKVQEGFSEVRKNSLSIDEDKQMFLEKVNSSEEITSTRESSSLDEDFILKIQKLPDIDDEYIELEPHLDHSVDELFKQCQVEDLNELQYDHTEVTEQENSPRKKYWDWECDEKDEVDILMEHRDLIEQMKTEMNSRNRALPTILEDSETPKIAEDLKPLLIDEKFEHCDRMEEIHKFCKSYSDRMRKLDVLNYQTLHAISILHLKDPVKQTSRNKSSVSSLKSIFLPNCYSGKLRKICADQTLKSLSDLHTDLERVYVGQVCFSWEILRWQYGKAKELEEYNSQDCHSYNQVAGEFQQFQVLVQRFIEDEPFQGPRVQNYVKKRHVILNLLQVPNIKDDFFKDKKRGGDEEGAISIAMLREIIEESMRVFWEFLQADKDGSSMSLKRIRSTKIDHNVADAELLMNIMSSLQKKDKRLKDILRSDNWIVKKFHKLQGGRVKHDTLISQVELKLVSRVLSLSILTMDQLVWCRTKLNRINFIDRRISVEPSFLLFPC